ncbi:stereocilin [Pleurodeles waltl]|uniref:stereocilin n=1 Tax=Pleurodeles waltl TaxID=8319 RepID=UPI0037099CF0
MPEPHLPGSGSQPVGQGPLGKPRPTPALKLKDFLVSLRGSRNWDSLLSFIQSVLKLFSKDQTAVTFLMENWEILSGLVDTLFQALISGTLGQDSVTIQGVLCSLMGRSYCGFSTEWLQQLLHLFEGTNWKPMVHVQSGSSTVGHGRLRPFSLLPGALREKRSNLTQHPAEQNHNEMQSLLQIIYRSSERGKRVQSVGSAVGSDEPLWEGLEGLRQNLLRRVGRSVYGNVNKKVSRMTGSLVNRVSSVIGIPKSDQEGKCSAGNLQQLLLWGIKHNIKWNAETLGFSTRSFPSPPPMMTCLKSAGTVPGNVTEDYSAARSLSAVAWEEPWNADDVLEAVCNETIPGLPGISNFTIYLYCNLFNSTDYSNQPAPDLRTTCSDAAWYLAAADGDSLWVRVCREFFPEEFNLTVCTNSSLVDNQNYNQPLMEGLCSNWSQSFDEAKLYRNSSGCPETLHNVVPNQELIWRCLLENRTSSLEILCSNDSLQNASGVNKTWFSKICPKRRIKSNGLNSSLLRDGTFCNYKAWSSRAFRNASLVEQCRGMNANGFKALVCRNISLYESLMLSHPWIEGYCSDIFRDSLIDGKCFLQRIVDSLPVLPNFDSSQICRSPAAYFMAVVTQLSECDDGSSTWMLNVNYLLKLLDFVLTYSNLGEVENEVRDQVAEAILLASLLDNSSFWASFQMNSSLSILQTVEWYLEEEHNVSLKKDLLSCFSPLLWDLIQNEENSTALEVLLQEYLQMPRDSFQKLLMSAENDAVKRFVSVMHRSWHRVQVTESDEQGLESLTSLLIQKFPHLTPQLFVDLSQFIPFMSISDILSLPTALLANESVLAAIKSHSSEMKFMQKRAFVKRLLVANTFGDVPSWPNYFLRAIQPLLPHLPLCHFMQLSPQQIRSLADGWEEARLSLVQGRYVAESLMNRSSEASEGKDNRLGNLVCYLRYEDLMSLFPLNNPFGSVGKKLLQCIANGTLNSQGRVAHVLAESLQTVNITAMDPKVLDSCGGIFPELGIRFIERLPDGQVDRILPKLQPADLTPAQATSAPICSIQTLVHGLSPKTLSSLSANVMVKVCQCLSPVIPLLSSAQKAAILQAIRAAFAKSIFQESGNTFKCLQVDQGPATKREDSLMPAVSTTVKAGKRTSDESVLVGFIRWELGTLAGGIDCNTLKQWSLRSEFLEVVKHLYGLPTGLQRNTRRCIVEEIQRRSWLSKEDLMRLGSEFIIDLPVKLINRLSNESVKIFLEHVNKQPTSFLRLPFHKQKALAHTALRVLRAPSDPEISGEVLDLLGPLVGFLDKESINKVNKENLLLRLDDLKMFCLSEEFTEQLGRLLTEESMLGFSRVTCQVPFFRDPVHWTQKNVEHVGTLLFSLSQEKLSALPKEVLTRDLMEWLLAKQRRWEASDLGRLCGYHSITYQHQMKVKKAILVSSFVRSSYRGNREPVPSCADMKMTFPAAWSATQVTMMSESDFEDCLGLISQDTSLSADQARASLAKSKQLFGPVKSMEMVHILQLGNLAKQLSEKELQEMELLDWGIVSFLGNMDGWTHKQMKAAAASILRQNGKRTSELELPELTAFGHFVCGLKVDEIEKINPQEFSMSAVFVGTLKLRCPEPQIEALAKLLVSPSAFGPVSSWGSDIFTEIGSLAVGLQDIDLSSLVPDQIQGLTLDAISLIPATKLAVIFTPAQLVMFTSEQAAAVTPEQFEHLNPEQRQAVQSAQYEGEVGHEHRALRKSSMMKHLSAKYEIDIFVEIETSFAMTDLTIL